jgi:hypothetical protein
MNSFARAPEPPFGAASAISSCRYAGAPIWLICVP